MRKLLIAFVVAASLAFSSTAYALSVYTVPQGGTGAGTFSSGRLLYGAGTASVKTVATSTLTATSPLSLSNPVAKVGGVNSVLTIDTSGAWSGNAGTATALAANGTNCSAGSYPLGVDASGNAENCTVAGAGSSFSFTPTTNFGVLANSTTTPIWFRNTLQASSTSQFDAANFWNGAMIGASTTPTALFGIQAASSSATTTLFVIAST